MKDSSGPILASASLIWLHWLLLNAAAGVFSWAAPREHENAWRDRYGIERDAALRQALPDGEPVGCDLLDLLLDGACLLTKRTIRVGYDTADGATISAYDRVDGDVWRMRPGYARHLCTVLTPSGWRLAQFLDGAGAAAGTHLLLPVATIHALDGALFAMERRPLWCDRELNTRFQMLPAHLDTLSPEFPVPFRAAEGAPA